MPGSCDSFIGENSGSRRWATAISTQKREEEEERDVRIGGFPIAAGE